MDGHAELPAGLAQPGEVGSVIVAVAEYWLAVVALLAEVVGLVGDHQARESGHGSRRACWGGDIVPRRFAQVAQVRLAKTEV
ncbi:hypothetical protein C1T15_28160, partial [Escherichia coli]